MEKSQSAPTLFAPYPGQERAGDFKTLSEYERTLFLSNIQ